MGPGHRRRGAYDPWNKLDYDARLYDARLGGFLTDIAEEQLRGAPTFYRERDYEWSDRERERAARLLEDAVLLGYLKGRRVPDWRRP